MLTPIHEPIEVIGVYKKAQFLPKKFQWRAKIFAIDRCTFVTNFKDGQIKKRIYSVLSQQTLYRLCFNRESEVWTLEELYHE